MKKNNEDIEGSRLRFVIQSIALLIIILLIVLYGFSKAFTTEYRVSLNNTPVGYVTSTQEFNEVVLKLEKDILDNYADSKVILKYEPEFTEVFCNNFTEDNMNIYDGTRANLLVEYIVYTVAIDNYSVDFDTQVKATDYIQKIKTNKLTKEPVLTQRIETKEPTLTSAEAIISTYNEIVSRYKPIKTQMQLFLEKTYKPANGILTSYFGYRTNPYPSYHTGLDIASSIGTSVYAWAAGTVISCGWDGDYGYSILVQHSNGFKTRYAHLSKVCASTGDTVAGGQQIGEMGSTGNSTGPHLHIEILLNDRFQNPLTYLKRFY